MAANTRIQHYWRDPSPAHVHKTGVSLHSHTQHSHETLALLPKYLGDIPLLRHALGKSLDYHGAFWTPPLTPRQAHRLEEKQIQRQFHLPGLISLTDHDDIQAGVVLHLLDRFRSAPISTEWTVPFGPTFFHLGIHNLPIDDADAIAAQLARYTLCPNPSDLARCLEVLNDFPDVLIVLNHPLWDETEVGRDLHRQLLQALLRAHRRCIHALEVNGLRGRDENDEVFALGQQIGLPVVAGGDRHGREPNAIINLSAAATFPEFVEEIRREKTSHVVFMPQYQLPLALRTARMVLDAIREYPETTHARQTWRERIFYRPTPDSEPVPIAHLCEQAKAPLLFAVADFATLCSRMACSRMTWMRTLIRRALLATARL